MAMTMDCTGQPDRAQLEAARARGCRTVINLRCEGEFDAFDERAVVESLGMRYRCIPVAGAADVTEAKARELQAALAEAGDAVLVHCGSANRVGALLAVGRWLDGAAPDDALEYGRRHGLAGLEPRVREVMRLV